MTEATGRRRDGRQPATRKSPNNCSTMIGDNPLER
jgi:hypothetical protein